jgi:hypothetical protein
MEGKEAREESCAKEAMESRNNRHHVKARHRQKFIIPGIEFLKFK